MSKNKLMFFPLALAAFFALFGILIAAPPASAHVSPVGCLNNDFVVNLQKSTSIAYDETNPNGATTITYSVDAGNPQDISGKGCDVGNVTITVTDPHGTPHTIVTGASYPIGTADAVLPTTVSYVANSADETGNNLVASVNATGDLHDSSLGVDPMNITKSVSVTVIHPNTTVTITPSASAVTAGGTISLVVTEQNTGDNPLTSPQVTLTPPGTVLNKASGTFTGGDTGNDGILGVGETWTWTVPGVVVSANTTYTAVGDGIDSLLNHVTFSAYDKEKATTDVKVVDLQILITGNSTNEVGVDHTFTVTVKEDLGDGAGFVAVSGATVTPGITGAGSLTGTGTCQTGTTDVLGQCTIIVHSTSAGVGTVSASTTVNVGGDSLTRALGDGLSGDSAKPTKTWVDANIALSPLTATNPVDKAHVITATVQQDPGTGLVSAPDGTLVTFSLLNNTAGAAFVGGINTCTTTGGTCSVSINTATAGSVDIHATTTFNVGGVSLTRATGDGLSGDSVNANKVYTETALTTTASGTVQLGGTIHDTAHLSGGVSPTGHVTFDVYGPGDATCQTSLGTLSATPDPVTANGDFVSANFTPAIAGTYMWIAHYSGDGSNNPVSTACGAENESVVVTPKTPSIATTLSATSVNAGTAVHDSSALTGATSNAGGTVTYSVYTDNTCTTLYASHQPSGNPVAVTAGVPGDSGAVTFDQAGTFYWQAVYSGDANNTGPVSSGCQTEILTVNQPQVATRTLGFWQNHTAFTESVFHNQSGGSVTLGGMVINTDAKLFGGFLAGISRTSTGTKRSALDQARMQLAQQWLAAELNCEAFACPANIQTLLAQASTDFSTGTASQILADASALDTYNNSGDSISSNLNQGSATPALSKSTANYVFWDVLN